MYFFTDSEIQRRANGRALLLSLLINRVIIARLVDGESIITDELSVVTSGCFGRPVQVRSGKIHVENTELLPIS